MKEKELDGGLEQRCTLQQATEMAVDRVERASVPLGMKKIGEGDGDFEKRVGTSPFIFEVPPRLRVYKAE